MTPAGNQRNVVQERGVGLSICRKLGVLLVLPAIIYFSSPSLFSLAKKIAAAEASYRVWHGNSQQVYGALRDLDGLDADGVPDLVAALGHPDAQTAEAAYGLLRRRVLAWEVHRASDPAVLKMAEALAESWESLPQERRTMIRDLAQQIVKHAGNRNMVSRPLLRLAECVAQEQATALESHESKASTVSGGDPQPSFAGAVESNNTASTAGATKANHTAGSDVIRLLPPPVALESRPVITLTDAKNVAQSGSHLAEKIDGSAAAGLSSSSRPVENSQGTADSSGRSFGPATLATYVNASQPGDFAGDAAHGGDSNGYANSRPTGNAFSRGNSLSADDAPETESAEAAFPGPVSPALGTSADKQRAGFGQPQGSGNLPQITADWREVEALFAALHGDANSNRQAREQLCELGVDSATVEAGRLAFHPDPDVRREVARTIWAAPGIDPLPFLYRLAQDPNPAVREEARSVLATIRNPSVEAFLRDISPSDGSSVMQAAIDAEGTR